MAKTIIRGLIAGLLLLIFLPAGCITYGLFVPHLLLNETTRNLYQYREVSRQDGPVNLIPGFFAGGEKKQDVERELLSAGLRSWSTRYKELPSDAVSMHAFLFRAGLINVACGNELYLLITYDAGDELQSATIKQVGACL